MHIDSLLNPKKKPDVSDETNLTLQAKFFSTFTKKSYFE